jgi:hypothetical protein
MWITLGRDALFNTERKIDYLSIALLVLPRSLTRFARNVRLRRALLNNYKLFSKLLTSPMAEIWPMPEILLIS